MRTMDGKKKIAMTGISALLIAGLVTGNMEYVTHTYQYDRLAPAAVTKEVENTTPLKAAKKNETAVTKEETVYATLDANGEVTDVIVSDWLKNSGSADGVEDKSTLQDIVNTKGDETFSQKDDTLQWETKGQDIYYQGKTDSELPVGVEIIYKLDGIEVKPQDILGKSGRLEMNIRYSNHIKKQVKVNGKKESVYAPFLMVTGMILPVEKFSNLTIDNGKVVSEGDNNIVVGYGMPGLSDSLALDDIELEDDVNIDTDKLTEKMSDSVTITADVSDFSMGATYTVATSDLFNDLAIDDVDGIDELEKKVDDMKDASIQLLDGTKDLEDGLETLDDSFSEYAKGIKSANKGAKSLNKGAKSLTKGTNEYTKGTDKLLGGVKDYVDGAGTLGNGVKSYTSGAKTITNGLNELNKAVSTFPAQYKQFGEGVKTFINSVTTLLSEANMKQLTEGTASLKSGIKQADDGIKQLQAGVSSMNTQIGEFKKQSESSELAQCQSALQQLKAQYEAMAEAADSAEEKANYRALATALGGASDYIDGGKQAAAALDAATNGKADGAADNNGKNDLALGLKQLQSATDVNSKEVNLYTGALSLEQSTATMSDYAKQLRESAPALLTGESTVRSGIDSVSDNVKKLAAGGKTLSANNKKLTEGADSLIKNSSTIKKNSKKITSKSASLRKGVKKLAAGAKSLFAGMGKINKATGDVTDGIAKLYDGSDDLHDGMAEFKREAVDKLADTAEDVTDEVGGSMDRLKGIQKLAKEYKCFSGIAKNMDGSVKFIMSTQEVKEEK